MIKLSDVKVRPQYRTRVRLRLVVLEYAWAHMSRREPWRTFAGMSVDFTAAL